ncbi:hypothetical protein ACTXT7_005147 [Hymenolepis weldensis]
MELEMHSGKTVQKGMKHSQNRFIFLGSQFFPYEIVSQQVQFTYLLNGLTSNVDEFVYDVPEKPFTTPYDLRFATLERIEEARRSININNNDIYQATPIPCYFTALCQQTIPGLQNFKLAEHKEQTSPPSKHPSTTQPLKQASFFSNLSMRTSKEWQILFEQDKCIWINSQTEITVTLLNQKIKRRLKDSQNFLKFFSNQRPRILSKRLSVGSTLNLLRGLSKRPDNGDCVDSPQFWDFSVERDNMRPDKFPLDPCGLPWFVSEVTG